MSANPRIRQKQAIETFLRMQLPITNAVAIQYLLHWAVEDRFRRFEINYKGPFTERGATQWSGGWSVCVYTTRMKRHKLHHVSPTLGQAVKQAIIGWANDDG